MMAAVSCSGRMSRAVIRCRSTSASLWIAMPPYRREASVIWATVDTPRRIDLIKESARLVSKMQYVDLDLVFEQYGISAPYSGGWDEDEDGLYAYAVHRLRPASDSEIEAVHAYLTRETADVPTDAGPPEVWAPGHFRLFMSHLSKYKTQLGLVRGFLAREGVSGFVAHTSIVPSREWEITIERALRSCHAMGAFLHQGFHESKWCDQEVGFALARRLPIAPIVLDDLMPYGFIGKYQALPARDLSPQKLARKIVDWLLAEPSLRPWMTEGTITALEASASFDATRQLMSNLGRADHFTPAQLERLSNAAKSNDQVSDAKAKTSGGWKYVPEIIEGIVEQRGAVVDQVPF
jgi:hypothetical protein